MAWYGMACQLRLGKARYGGARLGEFRFGKAWHGS